MIPRRPVIGITTDLQPWKNRQRFLGGTSYADLVAAAGGAPVALPPVPDGIGDYLRLCDGILVPGGDDIHPRFYGQVPRHELVLSDERRTWFEIDLLQGALRTRLPVLGICMGAQTLNVTLGGTLVQDIPAERPDAGVHRVLDASPLPVHDILVEEGSLLHRVLGQTRVPVNTSHHQSIDSPGGGLRVSARCTDGVVEAVEGEGDTFVMGVQWHPEESPHAEVSRRLLAAFVAAAAEKVRRG